MFYFYDFYGKKVLKSTLLDGCEHFFTTRDFPLFQGTREDLKSVAEKNVDFLIEKLNISENSLYRCKQMHTANVEFAVDDNNFFDNTDGIILTKSGTATFLNFADCIPIILYDPVENIGGVVHAGWRGTASKIQQNAVKMMMTKGSKPENIRAAIGAGIGKCCFDVNEDVFEKIFDGIDKNLAKFTFDFDEKSGKFFVDLKDVNKFLLNEISVQQVDVSDYCTYCNNDVFFSYRKENGDTARHSAVLKINKKDK